MTAPPRGDLLGVLGEAQRRGLVGPGPLEPQVRHAEAMGEAAVRAFGDGPTSAFAGLALDLGTGGGLPGLVLVGLWADSRWVLLDSRKRSVSFCRQAVARLGLEGRVEVVLARAEVVGRDAAHRGRYRLVTARGFGPPAVTAECSAPLLETGGRLVVSEPPGAAGERWPPGPLARLGLRLLEVVTRGDAGFAVFAQVEPSPQEFPRREGIPGKRPLF